MGPGSGILHFVQNDTLTNARVPYAIDHHPPPELRERLSVRGSQVTTGQQRSSIDCRHQSSVVALGRELTPEAGLFGCGERNEPDRAVLHLNAEPVAGNSGDMDELAPMDLGDHVRGLLRSFINRGIARQHELAIEITNLHRSGGPRGWRRR